MKTQEELLEELLEEVIQTRRYAEQLHLSSLRVIELVSAVFGIDIQTDSIDNQLEEVRRRLRDEGYTLEKDQSVWSFREPTE